MKNELKYIEAFSYFNHIHSVFEDCISVTINDQTTLIILQNMGFIDYSYLVSSG